MFFLQMGAYRARNRVVPIRPLLDRRGGGFQRFDPASIGEDAPRITAIPAMGQIFPDGLRITYQFIAKSR